MGITLFGLGMATGLRILAKKFKNDKTKTYSNQVLIVTGVIKLTEILTSSIEAF